MKDWRGRKVRTRVGFDNGFFRIPAGTVLVIDVAGLVKHLRGLPCTSCGVAPVVSVAATRDEFLSMVEFLPEGSE